MTGPLIMLFVFGAVALIYPLAWDALDRANGGPAFSDGWNRDPPFMKWRRS